MILTRRSRSEGDPGTPALNVTIRAAGSDDAGLVRALAALDDAPVLNGPVLLAFFAGEPVAALALIDQRVVADPFVHTQEAVALLRQRAEYIARRGRGTR